MLGDCQAGMSPLWEISRGMVLRWLGGDSDGGRRYDCIMLGQKNEYYLQEAVDSMLPVEKINSTFAVEDAKKAFERPNTREGWLSRLVGMM